MIIDRTLRWDRHCSATYKKCQQCLYCLYASIIHLYKRKGNSQSCEFHRGISLLSIAGKILAKILLNPLTMHLDQGLLPENQCEFWKEPGTTDMVFVARQLQEKCQEQNAHLFSTYVDLTKAFDTVSRNGMWRIMSKYGCPRKFLTMVKNISMMAYKQRFRTTMIHLSLSLSQTV